MPPSAVLPCFTSLLPLSPPAPCVLGCYARFLETWVAQFPFASRQTRAIVCRLPASNESTRGSDGQSTAVSATALFNSSTLAHHRDQASTTLPLPFDLPALSYICLCL